MLRQYEFDSCDHVIQIKIEVFLFLTKNKDRS